jgi:D-alanine-D-alanine ligase
VRVTVLFNDDTELAHGAASDAAAVVAVQACARAVEQALVRLGHEARLVAAPSRLDALRPTLARVRPDVVFNLVESLNGDATLEAAVVAELERGGVPFTGNRSHACAVALRKPLAKERLAAAGVRVADGIVVEPSRGADRTGGAAAIGRALAEFARAVAFPWIVKPSREDASHGVTRESVVRDLSAAAARVDFVLERYAQPALVERFVEGRELNVALVERVDSEGPSSDVGMGDADGPEVLPLAEIDFSRFAAGRPRLVTYDGKWVEGSEDWNATVVKDAELAAPLAARVAAIAIAGWRALQFRGYGRVDLRLDEANGFAPVVLELNPNPDLSPDAGFARAWSRTGRTYDELVARLLALARPGSS